MKKRKIMATLAFLLCCALCMGQQQQYKSYVIGDIVDDVPAFQNVVNYPKKSFSLKELRGKLVIIDFWATWCTSCIKLMPHMEALQKQFGSKIQVILVNPWETKTVIDKRMTYLKSCKTAQALSWLPNVIGDTIWRKIFPHSGVPHQVWIDSSGKVVATTTGSNATPEHIQAVLDGKKTNMVVKRDLAALGYDVKKKGLIPMADSSMHPLFYSVMLRKNPGFGPGATTRIDSVLRLYKFTGRNLTLINLFTEAYADMKPTFRMLVEARDSTAFQYPKDKNMVDDWNDKNRFSYEIAVPLSLKDSVKIFMRRDLARYLPEEKGITGSVELRKMTAYILKRTNDKVFKTRSITDNQAKKDTTVYHNYDVAYREVNGWIQQVEDLKRSIVFVDETGIAQDKHVFVDLPKNVKDKNEFARVLSSQGLDLKIEERMIPILVIKDAPAL